MPSKNNIKKVKELTESLSKAKAVYFTEYHGLSVGEITRLRSEFFKENIEYRVEKNTLIKLRKQLKSIQVKFWLEVQIILQKKEGKK